MSIFISENIDIFPTLVAILGYSFLLISSGWIVNLVLEYINIGDLDIDKQTRDTGTIIGKCENI